MLPLLLCLINGHYLNRSGIEIEGGDLQRLTLPKFAVKPLPNACLSITKLSLSDFHCSSC